MQQVILDLIMPKIDGFGVLTEMQKRKDRTPVIVASNLSQDEDFTKAKDLLTLILALFISIL